MRPRETVHVTPPRVVRAGTLVEAIGDQGNAAIFSASNVPFDVGVLTWASPDGAPMPVRITFPCPMYKAGSAITVPRVNQVFQSGFAAAVIEYTAGGSVGAVVITDWPLNGRSVVIMASRVTIKLRTQSPGSVTPAAQALYPVTLSDAGPVTSRDFAPMTYTDVSEQSVPGPGAVSLSPPQNATAVMLNPQTAGVQMTVTCIDDAGDPTLIQRYAAATAGTERPEVPTPLPANCQTVSVSSTGLAPYTIRPVWLIDL